jgi:hypothetical protein
MRLLALLDVIAILGGLKFIAIGATLCLAVALAMAVYAAVYPFLALWLWIFGPAK